MPALDPAYITGRQERYYALVWQLNNLKLAVDRHAKEEFRKKMCVLTEIAAHIMETDAVKNGRYKLFLFKRGSGYMGGEDIIITDHYRGTKTNDAFFYGIKGPAAVAVKRYEKVEGKPKGIELVPIPEEWSPGLSRKELLKKLEEIEHTVSEILVGKRKIHETPASRLIDRVNADGMHFIENAYTLILALRERERISEKIEKLVASTRKEGADITPRLETIHGAVEKLYNKRRESVTFNIENHREEIEKIVSVGWPIEKEKIESVLK
ncbi:MAG: hypothetical protein AB1468_05505, partial [Candidatus Micrarchaeota archaeon]